MGNLGWKQYPTTHVTYQFINRRPSDRFNPEFELALRSEIEALGDLSLTSSEQNWLKAKGYFPDSFIDFLHSFRLRPDQVSLALRANHLFVAPLAVLFFVGILFPRADPRAALAGFFAGLATGIFVAFSKELFDMETPIGFIWVLPGSFSISFVVSWLMSLVFPKKPLETTD